jgi:hypothetical protein
LFAVYQWGRKAKTVVLTGSPGMDCGGHGLRAADRRDALQSGGTRDRGCIEAPHMLPFQPAQAQHVPNRVDSTDDHRKLAPRESGNKIVLALPRRYDEQYGFRTHS